MYSGICPEKRFDSAMGDFSVLNHLQVRVSNVTELLFLDNNLVVAL